MRDRGEKGLFLRPVFALILVLPLLLLLIGPLPVLADTPVSVVLAGWGWCPSYSEVTNVTLALEGTAKERTDAPHIADLFLTGEITFIVQGKTDSFPVEMKGTRVRSMFYLKQISGENRPFLVEIEGLWLTETDYVACEGRLVQSSEEHLGKPYFFALRTGEKDVPERTPGTFTQNIEFIIQKGALCLDIIADRLSEGGQAIRELIGSVMTQITVILREVRRLGVPYVT